MKTPAPSNTPRNLVTKLAIALALVATPLAAVSLASVDNVSTTIAGVSYPDDVDPG